MRLFILLLIMMQTAPFKESQLKFQRVKMAYREKEEVVKKYFTQKNLEYDSFRLFVRAFKKEKALELWVQQKSKDAFVLLHTFPFCQSSGTLGPKRKEGDRQIPEGVYFIDRFNPASDYHLSLRVNYPNASDRILSDRTKPGGEIYIHGNCVTTGCIPLTDDKIKELYILCVNAKSYGQEAIPVHIFPDRLNPGVPERLAQEEKAAEPVKAFWRNLQSVYLDFETTKKLKNVKVNKTGAYIL